MLKLSNRSFARACVHPLCLVAFGVLSAGAFETGCSSSDATGSGGGHSGGSAGAPAGGAPGKAGSGGGPTATAGAPSGGAGGGSAGASGSPSSGGKSGGSSGGGTGVDPALDQACTAQCAMQSTLACVETPCHDKCVALAATTPSANYDCKKEFATMLQCTSKLTPAQWQCSPDDGKAAPVMGQCTTSACAWTCCVTDLYAPSDLLARCNCP